jgi:hypothetical protein
MSYYTYRIRVINARQVQVEKRDEQGEVLGEPAGVLTYEENRQRLDELCTAAFKNELQGTAVVELGELLFRTLFDDTLRQDFVGLYNKAIHDEHKLLRIELDVDERSLPDIAALPWEFMRLPTEANLGALWLATAPNLIFSRRRAQWFAPRPIQLAPGEKLRIALAVSAPQGLGPVEYKAVWQGLEKLAEQQLDQIELLPLLEKAAPQSIDDLLAAKPHIFHFIGHARLHDEAGQSAGQIALIDDLFDDPIWCGAERFSELFNRHRPGVILLQACEGAALSAAQAFVGVASRVVQQNIPVVVAMQHEVSNSTAIRFARRFYDRLARLEPVDQAAQEGRRSISLGPIGYSKRDFATPVIFMRVRDGHLFVSQTEATPEITPEPVPAATPAATAATRGPKSLDMLSSLRLDTALPSQVQQYRTFELAVAVRQFDSPILKEKDLDQTKSGDLVVKWDETTKSISMRIHINAPECTITDDSRNFTLYEGQDSPIIFFQLTPQQIGRISIVITVYQEKNWLGDTRLDTLVQEQLVGKVETTIYSKPIVIEAPATLSLPQVAALGRLISANFSADELRDLAAFLGIDYDDLSGGSKAAKARSLADHCRRHGKVPDLWAELHQEREHVNWGEAL